MDTIYRVYIDLETTGLFPWKSGICQMAYIIDASTQEHPQGEVLCEKSHIIQTFPKDEITMEALQVNGLTLDGINNGMHPRDFFDEFAEDMLTYCGITGKKTCDTRAFFVGYNSLSFDEPFLRKFFTKCRAPAFSSYFYTPNIDVMPILGHYLQYQRKDLAELATKLNIRGQFKLELLAKALGTTTKGALHDALTDVRITRELYLQCLANSSL